MTLPNTVKVFISYTRETAAHDTAVRQLGDRLCSDGVDCSMDQYVVSPPEGWPKWMDQQIRKADYILVVCTEAYNRRASGQEIDGKGLGAKWESYLTYQSIYDNNSLNSKFIPILITKDDKKYIPSPLAGATYYDLSHATGYELLYRHITDQPLVSKPPLGVIRRL